MMKRVMFLILSLAVLIGMGLATSAAVAKDGVFGDMRWRWESFKNFEDLDSDNDDTWTAHYLRARLGYQGRLGETGFYKMSVENMRVLGGDYPSPFYSEGTIFDKDITEGFWPYQVARPFGTNNSDVFVHEAYFGAEDFLFDDFSLKFGRFALNYGRERIIGSNDWSNHAANRFDGAIGQFGFETGWIDLLWLKLAEGGPEGAGIDFYETSDVNLRGLYGHFDLAEGFFLEPHLLWFNANNTEDDPTSDEPNDQVDDTNLYGFGALVDYMSDMGLHLYGEAQFQTGSTSEADGTEIFETNLSGMGFYAGAFYTFASDVEPFLGLEYNYASGQSEDADEDEAEVFLNPFGSNTEYLGRMNIIGWGPNLTEGESSGLGVSALRFAGGLSPAQNLDISANFFLFSTAEDYTFFDGETEDEGSSIGSEIDLQLDYYHNDFLSFEAGLGLFSFNEDYIGDDEADAIWYNWIGSRIAF